MSPLLPILLLVAVQAAVVQGSKTTFSCRVSSGGECPPAFCPGDEVIYTFDAGRRVGLTFWDFPLNTCSCCTDAIILPHYDLKHFWPCDDSVLDSTCGPFFGRNKGRQANGYCLVSELIVTATADLNNSLITYSTGISPMTVEGTTIMKIADKPLPPAPPTGVTVADCVGDSVNLRWQGPKGDTGITNYILSATPPVDSCDPNCTVSAPTLEHGFSGLEREVSYVFAVQAANCNGRQAGSKATLELTLSTLAVSGLSMVILTVAGDFSSENSLNDLSQIVRPDEILCKPVEPHEVGVAQESQG